jgi:hypothetical protein
LENAEQSEENERIKAETQDIIDRQKTTKLNFTQMEKDYPRREKQMSEILLLIQEQQLKKQQVDIDVSAALGHLEQAVSEKENISEECCEIEKQHLRSIEQLRQQHEMTMQQYQDSQISCQLDHQRLQSKVLELQQEISTKTEHKHSIEKETHDQENSFNFYKNKLLVVDAYSAEMEIVVHEIHKLALSNGAECADSNSIVLGEIISSVSSFLEWFETIFIFKLHSLSTLMLNSQI